MQISKTTQSVAWGITLLRIATGIVFLGAGVQNLLQNLFLHGFSQLPDSTVIVGSLVELFCGAALVVGLLTRWACIPLALLMLADILVMHPPSSFLVGDEGVEHAFLRLSASATLVLAGPGKVALDNVVTIRRGSKQPLIRLRL
jgi:putative oxidoreductase